MTRSFELFIGGLFAAMISLCIDAKAEKRTPEQRCIEIEHIGSQDTPVGALRLCIGAKGGSRSDSLLENKWTFYFDVTAYRIVETFVINHIPKGTVDDGDRTDSSFSITWRSREGKRQYVLPIRTKCTYLRDLIHSVTGEQYAEFRQAGWDLMAREGCPPPLK